MSQHVQHLPSVRLRFPRRSVMWLAGVLILAALIASTVIITQSGTSHSASPAQVTSRSTGGPNETLRGQAAAAAARAPRPVQATGGPNETLRGQAAANATK